MADLDIAERRLPQDGRIRVRFSGKDIDFRVSSIPSKHGEKVVMRQLDKTGTTFGLDHLITEKETLSHYPRDGAQTLRHHLRHRANRFWQDHQPLLGSSRAQHSRSKHSHS
jgi:hypothetical protein